MAKTPVLLSAAFLGAFASFVAWIVVWRMASSACVQRAFATFFSAFR